MEGAQLLGRLLSGRAAAEDDERPGVRRRGGPSRDRNRLGQLDDDVVLTTTSSPSTATR